MKKICFLTVIILFANTILAQESNFVDENALNTPVKINSPGAEYYNTAVEYMSEKKYVNAMKSFNKAIAEEPENYEYYYKRGVLRYTSFKDFPGAIADFTKVTELNSEYPGIYSVLGYVSLFNKDFNAAQSYLEQAEQKNPDDIMIFKTRALQKIYNQDYSAAIEEYDKAINICPNDSELYLRRGYAKAYIRKYKSAMADYDKAIELDPKNYSAYEKRSEIHNAMLRSGRAKKDMIKSEQIRFGE